MPALPGGSWPKRWVTFDGKNCLEDNATQARGQGTERNNCKQGDREWNCFLFWWKMWQSYRFIFLKYLFSSQIFFISVKKTKKKESFFLCLCALSANCNQNVDALNAKLYTLQPFKSLGWTPGLHHPLPPLGAQNPPILSCWPVANANAANSQQPARTFAGERLRLRVRWAVLKCFCPVHCILSLVSPRLAAIPPPPVTNLSLVATCDGSGPPTLPLQAFPLRHSKPPNLLLLKT